MKSITKHNYSIDSCSFGAASELLASVDLIQRGWSVFRNVSTHAPCDLVAIKNETIIRIEVKSRTSHYDRTKSDVLAVVNQDSGEISYTPDITNESSLKESITNGLRWLKRGPKGNKTLDAHIALQEHNQQLLMDEICVPTHILREDFV